MEMFAENAAVDACLFNTDMWTVTVGLVQTVVRAEARFVWRSCIDYIIMFMEGWSCSLVGDASWCVTGGVCCLHQLRQTHAKFVQLQQVRLNAGLFVYHLGNMQIRIQDRCYLVGAVVVLGERTFTGAKFTYLGEFEQTHQKIIEWFTLLWLTLVKMIPIR